MSSTMLPPALPAIDNTMGAIFIGMLLAGSLWGVSCVQAYEYYVNYPEDPIQRKLMVAVVLTLDTLHQILISHVSYTYLVSHYSNPAFLETVVWSLLWQVLPTALISFIVQSFFTWRIWELNRKRQNWPIIIIISGLVLANFVLTLVYFAKGLSVKTFLELPRLGKISRAVNAVGAAGDILIAATLIYLLRSLRSGFEKTDKIVSRLILFSLNTGLITSICALLSLIFISALPNTFIFITFYAPLSRLYTNSLLASLNARKKITGASSAEASSVSMERLSRRRGELSRNGQKTPDALSIMVNTQTAMVYERPMPVKGAVSYTDRDSTEHELETGLRQKFESDIA